LGDKAGVGRHLARRLCLAAASVRDDESHAVEWLAQDVRGLQQRHHLHQAVPHVAQEFATRVEHQYSRLFDTRAAAAAAPIAAIAFAFAFAFAFAAVAVVGVYRETVAAVRRREVAERSWEVTWCITWRTASCTTLCIAPPCITPCITWHTARGGLAYPWRRCMRGSRSDTARALPEWARGRGVGSGSGSGSG
jgi:hypothetical protein